MSKMSRDEISKIYKDVQHLADECTKPVANEVFKRISVDMAARFVVLVAETRKERRKADCRKCQRRYHRRR